MLTIFDSKNLLEKIQNSTTICVGNEVKRFPAKQKKRYSSQIEEKKKIKIMFVLSQKNKRSNIEGMFLCIL